MNNYTISITSPTTAERAYDAITKEMSEWWTPMSSQFKETGDEAKTGFGGNSYWAFKAITLNAPYQVELECIESRMIMDSLDNAEEWLGTILRFDISEHEGQTRIIFTHFGLHPKLQCYDVCSGGWNHYIPGSLRNYLHNVGGNPNTY